MSGARRRCEHPKKSTKPFNAHDPLSYLAWQQQLGELEDSLSQTAYLDGQPAAAAGKMDEGEVQSLRQWACLPSSGGKMVAVDALSDKSLYGISAFCSTKARNVLSRSRDKGTILGILNPESGKL